MLNETSPDYNGLLTSNAEIIYTEFTNSMNALQTQDVAQSEKSLIRARNSLNFLNKNVQEGEIVPFKIMCSLIEVGTRVIKSSFYTMEERYIKAMEELNAAWLACKEAELNFPNIADDYKNDPDVGQLIPLFKNMFICYETIISSTKKTVEGEILKESGKYVDELKTLRSTVEELRKINTVHFEHDNFNFSVSLVTLMNNIADSTEKKAERLEEKRKKIEFIKPIDKKIFIVHGHDIANLHELTKMLKEIHGLSPIVLNEMPDMGHTVIEKFEEYARLCAFAFVLVTPDDFVENKKKKYYQGRPNVLFELGWFCGRFGRDKVRILRQRDTQLPSDLNGLVTIDFYEKLEEVYRKITFDLEYNGIIERKDV